MPYKATDKVGDLLAGYSAAELPLGDSTFRMGPVQKGTCLYARIFLVVPRGSLRVRVQAVRKMQKRNVTSRPSLGFYYSARGGHALCSGVCDVCDFEV
jgi:hypothetical protein